MILASAITDIVYVVLVFEIKIFVVTLRIRPIFSRKIQFLIRYRDSLQVWVICKKVITITICISFAKRWIVIYPVLVQFKRTVTPSDAYILLLKW